MKKPRVRICRWDEDRDGAWWTDCSNGFVTSSESPQDNGMKFCCYCGKKLKEVKFEDTES